MRAEILGRAERKGLFQELKESFGFEGKLPYGFLRIQERVKVLSRDFKNFKVEGLTIENLGLLFGKWVDEGLILTLEGSQMVGRKATKNVLELGSDQAGTWMTGGGIEVEGKRLEGKIVIIKHNGDFLGCGKISQGRIWSPIPPHRRVRKGSI